MRFRLFGPVAYRLPKQVAIRAMDTHHRWMDVTLPFVHQQIQELQSIAWQINQR